MAGGIINTITANNSTHPLASTAYAVCSSNASSQVKIVAVKNYDNVNIEMPLIKGITLPIFFINSNTAINPILQINDHAAVQYPIYKFGNTAPGITPSDSWMPESMISLTFYGDCWRINNYFDLGNSTGSINDNSNDPLYLIGAKTQTSAASTYSNNNIYSQNGKLYSNNDQVVTVNGEQNVLVNTINNYIPAAALSHNVTSQITEGSSSLPTAAAVYQFISSESIGGTITEQNIDDFNQHRILLSSGNNDEEITTNTINKNSHLKYIPGQNNIILDNIANYDDQEEQPDLSDNSTLSLTPDAINLQKGDFTAEEGEKGQALYAWNGIVLEQDILEDVHVEQEEQGEPTYQLNHYQTTISANKIDLGGKLTVSGQTNLNDTLFTDSIGLVTIGNKNEYGSIKLINSYYEGAIDTDLKGISMGKDNLFREDSYDFNYWTGYNPYQLKLHFMDSEVSVQGATPYNYPTQAITLNTMGMNIYEGSAEHRADNDNAINQMNLSSSQLRFISRTWEQETVIDDETGEETTVLVPSSDYAVVNKQSIDRWNNGGNSTYKVYTFSSGASSYQVPFSSTGQYMVVIQKHGSYYSDRLFLMTNEQSSSHFTQIFSGPGVLNNQTTDYFAASTTHKGSITNINMYPGQSIVEDTMGYFTFSYTGSSGLTVTVIKLADIA